MTDDPVNSPAHYAGSIECVDAIRAALSPEEFRGWLKGNAMKYLWRCGRKGPALIDAQKGRKYQDWLVAELSKAEGKQA